MGEKIGALIKRLREEKGLSQRQLATLSGVDRGYINQLEAGRGGSISLRTARKLAAALEKPPEIFLQDLTTQHPETPHELLERIRINLPESVPIYEDFTLHAGRPTEAIDYIPVVRDQARGKDLEGYVVHGECLEPEINDGDIIIIDRDGQIEHGNIVACLIQGELHLARLRKVADELFLENNERRIKLEEAQITAPVIEVRRRLK